MLRFTIMRAPRGRFSLHEYPHLGTFASQEELADMCVRFAQDVCAQGYSILYV